MHLSSPRAFRAAALLGFLAVGLGAFGAHGLKGMFAVHPEAREWWEKAVFYHAIHAVTMLVLAGVQPFPAGAWGCFGAGIFLFSGSLYALALVGTHWLVFLTPLGGVFLLAGWLWLAVRPPSGTLAAEDRRP